MDTSSVVKLPIVKQASFLCVTDLPHYPPDRSQTKVTKNILHCLKHVTQMGWLSDPSEQCVFVYLPERPSTLYDQPDASLPVPEFAKEFNLTVWIFV